MCFSQGPPRRHSTGLGAGAARTRSRAGRVPLAVRVGRTTRAATFDLLLDTSLLFLMPLVPVRTQVYSTTRTSILYYV